MNDLVQNKIVEQKDILKIIEIFNNFYQERMEIFDKTKKDIETEDKEYYEWNKQRYQSNDYDVNKQFEYKKHYNKLVYESFTFSFYGIDGLSYEDKSYKEAQIIMNSGYSSFEKITIRLDMTWNKEYIANEYKYNDKNNANLSVSVTFMEDDVYTHYSSKNADGDMKFFKSEISDVFENLQPKYSNIISRRESIKYNSTLGYAYFISAFCVLILTIFLKRTESNIGFGWWQLVAFIVLALFINMFLTPSKLNSLYKLILPKKKTVYEGKELKKVDNIKEFKSTAEVQIGKNAFKAGKREQIVEIINKSKRFNAISLVISAIIVVIICMFF